MRLIIAEKFGTYDIAWAQMVNSPIEVLFTLHVIYDCIEFANDLNLLGFVLGIAFDIEEDQS